MEKIVRVGVGVYIFNKNDQLLLGLRQGSHDSGTWCPPGGHLEFGESNEQAAIREVKEETGLIISTDDIYFENITNDFYPDINKHYITLHLFCKKYKGEPKVMEPEKCVAWKWFDLNDLPQNLMLPVKNFLKAYHLKSSSDRSGVINSHT